MGNVNHHVTWLCGKCGFNLNAAVAAGLLYRSLTRPVVKCQYCYTALCKPPIGIRVSMTSDGVVYTLGIAANYGYFGGYRSSGLNDGYGKPYKLDPYRASMHQTKSAIDIVGSPEDYKALQEAVVWPGARGTITGRMSSYSMGTKTSYTPHTTNVERGTDAHQALATMHGYGV